MTGHVKSLDLSCSWLRGTIFANSSLFQLRYLQSLILAFNDLGDSQIPPGFGYLASLSHLNLSASSLAGPVPSEISWHSKLVVFDLSRNYMLDMEAQTLENLVQNLTELRELYLDEINMPAVVPNTFRNLSQSLPSLSLDGCQLKGEFPTNIFALPYLQMLILSANLNLTAHFPESNWNSPLEFLDVTSVSFSILLPESIGNLKSLRKLILHNCNFGGPLPGSLGNLTQLTDLFLAYNSFEGQIPESISSFEYLMNIDLSNNKLSGQIPNVFLNPHLCFLDISNNQLTGPIPSHASELPSLTQVFLQHNLISGTIPTWLFTLPSLVQLDLSFNRLSGHIDEFNDASLCLANVDLGFNELDGPIPGSFFQLANLTGVALSSNNFTVELAMFSKFKNLMGLDLSRNRLSLESSVAVNFTWSPLWSLRLSSCNITGEFPVFLTSLHSSLHVLDLSDNNIYGEIPSWLGNFSWSLLNLSHNLLEGPLFVPPMYAKYSIYSISDNKLTGEIPPSICSYNYVQMLDLSRNDLSGMIPPCLANFSAFLSDLALQNNNFHGAFLATFSEDNMLRSLNLNGNQLEGPIPRSLVNCRTLQVLNLGNNKISDTFPNWLGSLPELRVLVLRYNQFHGPIGDDFIVESPFQRLQVLDISNNEFTGNLPSGLFENLKAMVNADVIPGLWYIGDEYYRDSVTITVKGHEINLSSILTIFNTIDLSKNSLQGEIPEVMGELRSLLGLNLSYNSLTGHIPVSLQHLTELESLGLSSNMLSGEIPPELTSLTFLPVLNLSQNQLAGPIPQGNQFDTFQNDSYYGNLGLCGAPLTRNVANHSQCYQLIIQTWGPSFPGKLCCSVMEVEQLLEWLCVILYSSQEDPNGC